MGRGSHLGDLEELTLLAVLRLGADADGRGVKEELAAVAGRTVSISTVYVTLMRLEEKGYAGSEKGSPTGERGGKARRFYSVTPPGREALERTRATRDAMWSGVEKGGARA